MNNKRGTGPPGHRRIDMNQAEIKWQLQTGETK
jgi:hypothetical protein